MHTLQQVPSAGYWLCASISTTDGAKWSLGCSARNSQARCAERRYNPSACGTSIGGRLPGSTRWSLGNEAPAHSLVVEVASDTALPAWILVGWASYAILRKDGG